MTKSARKEVDFTNKLGQTISVGEEVLVITMCTSNLGITRGVYLGMTGDSVQVRVPGHVGGYKNRETGEVMTFFEAYRDQRILAKCDYASIPIERVSTLQLNRIYKLAA